MMDIEKLIHCLQCCARVDAHNGGCDDCGLEYCGPECQQLCGTAAATLSTLQAENKRLNKIVCSIPTTPDSGRTVSQYDKEMSMCAYLDDLEAENEKLRADLNDLKAQWDMYGGDEGITSTFAELEQVKRERDAIEQDFRAFAKQWWEEDSGFPCRWCKFENSGGCEWKAKHPNEEKICAGRAFEWRGQKEN